MATTETTHQHNDYWKLPHYNLTAEGMKAELDNRNYPTTGDLDKNRLREHLRRSDMGLPSYAPYSNDYLRDLLAARGINHREVITSGGLGNRKELIALLDKREFHRFRDLPPELRNRVYELYFAHFREKTLYAPTQPPLTQTGSLVRRETLQMFYSLCTFKIAFHRHQQENKTLLYIPNQVLLFFQCTTVEHLCLIRRVHVCVNSRLHDLPQEVSTNAPDLAVIDNFFWFELMQAGDGNGSMGIEFARGPSPRFYGDRIWAMQVYVGNIVDAINEEMTQPGQSVVTSEHLYLLRLCLEKGYQ